MPNTTAIITAINRIKIDPYAGCKNEHDVMLQDMGLHMQLEEAVGGGNFTAHAQLGAKDRNLTSDEGIRRAYQAKLEQLFTTSIRTRFKLGLASPANSSEDPKVEGSRLLNAAVKAHAAFLGKSEDVVALSLRAELACYYFDNNIERIPQSGGLRAGIALGGWPGVLDKASLPAILTPSELLVGAISVFNNPRSTGSKERALDAIQKFEGSIDQAFIKKLIEHARYDNPADLYKSISALKAHNPALARELFNVATENLSSLYTPEKASQFFESIKSTPGALRDDITTAINEIITTNKGKILAAIEALKISYDDCSSEAAITSRHKELQMDLRRCLPAPAKPEDLKSLEELRGAYNKKLKDIGDSASSRVNSLAINANHAAKFDKHIEALDLKLAELKEKRGYKEGDGLYDCISAIRTSLDTNKKEFLETGDIKKLTVDCKQQIAVAVKKLGTLEQHRGAMGIIAPVINTLLGFLAALNIISKAQQEAGVASMKPASAQIVKNLENEIDRPVETGDFKLR